MSEAIAGAVGLVVGAVLVWVMLKGKIDEMKQAVLQACKIEAVSFFTGGEFEARVLKRVDGPSSEDQQA